MELVNIKNVVKATKIITKEYPFGWDCAALADSVQVVWFENGEFKEQTFMVDPRFGWHLEHTELTLEYAENVQELEQEYQKHLLQKRIDESKKVGHSVYAKIGDTIEVYKGRKYPKGSQFKIKGETTWKDMYGRTQACYWITECGKKVNKFNCVIVG